MYFLERFLRSSAVAPQLQMHGKTIISSLFLMVHIRRATEVDIDALKDFHVTNHLDETCHFPGEREHQMSELRIDFPHLYSTDLFLRGMFWLATPEKNGDTIIGCIGISPDKDEPKRISWLNTFSVAKKMRGNNIGSTLLKVALEAVILTTYVWSLLVDTAKVQI